MINIKIGNIRFKNITKQEILVDCDKEKFMNCDRKIFIDFYFNKKKIISELTISNKHLRKMIVNDELDNTLKQAILKAIKEAILVENYSIKFNEKLIDEFKQKIKREDE